MVLKFCIKIYQLRQANQKWAATHPVQRAEVSRFRVASQGKLRKLHQKLTVIDRQVVIAGRFNYTGAENRLNDENIIILGNHEFTKTSTVEKQKRLASYAVDEIERIVQSFGRPLT